MSTVVRDRSCFGKHSDFPTRCQVRRASMVRRFQARMNLDAPTYSEIERFVLAFNRRLDPGAQRRERTLRTRLFIAWMEWNGKTPSAVEILRRVWEGAII